jgi:hypothetical protein
MVALAKLDVLGNHRDRAVGTDLDEGPKGPEIRLGPHGQDITRGTTHQQGPAHQCRADHQFAASGAGFELLRLYRCVHNDLP